MKRIAFTTLVLSSVLGLGTIAASAHPRLQASIPARDAKLVASPQEIRLNFSEGLVPAFSGLELKSGNKIVPTGKAALVPGDDKKMVVPVKARLVPGAYSVTWHAVSVDTHRVAGSYSFKVVK